MASTIVTKNSSTASAVPVAGDLTKGELAVNVTDKKLYTKDNGGSVVKLVGGLGNQEANAVAITGGAIDGTTVGSTTAAAGAFTTLAASSTVSGTGFSNYLASPPAIGGTAAAAGSFTTLAASGNFSLSGGTANGVLYLNGSKVATSGSALTFDGSKFTVLPTGAGGGELFKVGFSGGSNYVRIGAYSGYGEVLSESGNMVFGASGANSVLTYTNSVLRQSIGSDGTAIWNVAGSEAMRLTSTGLGIGTSSPSVKLDVTGSSNLIQRITTSGSGSFGALHIVNTASNGEASIGFRDFSDSDASSWVIGKSVGQADAFGFYYNGTKMLLDTSGNLGLGVTPKFINGYTSLEVKDASLASSGSQDLELSCNAYFNSGWKYSNASQASRYEQYQGKHTWFTAASGTAGNAITFTQAMTLDASGNLTIGATVTGAYQNVNSFYYLASNAYGGVSHVSGTASGSEYFNFSYNANVIGSITQNGTTAVAYNTSSDYRLKNIDGPLTGSGAFIDALKPKVGTWKADGSKFVGFLAHEVQEVSPNSVVGQKDAVDADGKPIMQAMEYGSAEFIANIIAELQSLRARVAALES